MILVRNTTLNKTEMNKTNPKIFFGIGMLSKQ